MLKCSKKRGKLKLHTEEEEKKSGDVVIIINKIY